MNENLHRLELSLEEGVRVPSDRGRKRTRKSEQQKQNCEKACCFGGTTYISELPGCGMIWWEMKVWKAAEEGAECGGPGVLLIRSLDYPEGSEKPDIKQLLQESNMIRFEAYKDHVGNMEMLWWSRPGGRGMNYKIISLVWIRDGKRLN